MSWSAQPLVLDKPDKISVCHVDCRGVGGVNKQASRGHEPGIGAGAVIGPAGALLAGDGRDLLGICINDADGFVRPICHIQLVAGYIQADRKEELGAGAGAVIGPAGALLAGEGRDILRPGIKNPNCVVLVIRHVQAGAGDSQVVRIFEPGGGACAVVAPKGAAAEGRHLLRLGVDNAECVTVCICHIQFGAGDSQASRIAEPGVGAGAVGGAGEPRDAGNGALLAGEGRDILRPGVDMTDGEVSAICHVQAGAGDSQAPRSVEPGGGAGAVGGPADALHAGEGRDLLRLGVDNADGVVKCICHIQFGAGDSQAFWIVELGGGAEAVVSVVIVIVISRCIWIASEGRDHRIINCWVASRGLG